MEDPGQTAVQNLSPRPDPAPVARDRDPRSFTPHASCYAPGLEQRSPGPIDVIAALVDLFEPPTADRTREFGGHSNLHLHLHEKMG